jgi:alanine dehydrogenase
MIVGVTKEIKNNENRVGLTPAGVRALVKAGHKVEVEAGAGLGSAIPDADYKAAGANLIPKAADVWKDADILVKVKEPLESEYDLMREGQTLFTYLHLAPNPELTTALIKRKVTGIAYETVQLPNKSLPLLAPMSEVAGRMSIQVGATLLQKYSGGRGILLGGVPGVAPADVLVIGGGVVGTNAARMAMGLGARVTIMDISKARLQWIDEVFGGRIATLMFSDYAVAEEVTKADLLVGAVLVPGARAPKTVTEAMVKTMKPGSVIVDVAIDQGGSIETIDRVTTHDHPCYEKYGVIHYSVANMPGAVPRTSTFALAAATLPYLLELARKGPEAAMRENEALKLGLNTYRGKITFQSVAQAQGFEYVSADSLLA